MNKKSKTKEQLMAELHDLQERVAALEEGLNSRSAPDEKSKLLASVVAESVDAIIAHDLDGRITAWNRGAEKMYGYLEDEATRMNISAIIPDDRRNEISAMVQNVRSGKDGQFLQTKRKTKDGRIVDVWITITKLLDEQGNMTGLATSERDVTAHIKVLEEVETALALAEQYTEDIERLVAERTASLIALNVADRIVNPAVVIGTMARRMIENRDHDSATRADLEMILRESEKLQDIIREFNNLVENRRTVFTNEDLNEVVKEAMICIKGDLETKGVHIESDLSEAPLYINMNRNVLMTAVFYILKNALDATPRGGNIIATTREKEDAVELMISDSGCGISEENIGRVFDNFFTTKSNGIGMGLPFVKHIIDEHYGDIHIESEESCGTKCTVTFPVRWLKLSEGRLSWEHPMLPMSKEQGYPVKVQKSTHDERRTTNGD